MSDILSIATETLIGVGFSVERISINGRDALTFEDATVLGFLLVFSSPSELITRWNDDSRRAISDHQLGLRLAGQKAWNTYMVLLAAGQASFQEGVALSAIEEDLTGTRKIARAGIHDGADLQGALLALLPLQAAPKLEAVDIPSEIRQRATELPHAVEAFLSNAEESVVLQALEQ
jgi:hypothetical protein